MRRTIDRRGVGRKGMNKNRREAVKEGEKQEFLREVGMAKLREMKERRARQNRDAQEKRGRK